jgi:KUP system potassium uptake protein
VAATGVLPGAGRPAGGGCALKFLQGGWFPLVLGAALFTVMATWRAGASC